MTEYPLAVPILTIRQIQLKFINRYRDTWPAGIAVLSGRIVNLDKLVTHRFPLEQAVEALEFSSKPANGSIKVQIVDERDVTLEKEAYS